MINKTLRNIVLAVTESKTAFVLNESRLDLYNSIVSIVNKPDQSANLNDDVYNGIISHVAEKFASISSGNTLRLAITLGKKLAKTYYGGNGEAGLFHNLTPDRLQRYLDADSSGILSPDGIAKMSRFTAGVLSTNALKQLMPQQIERMKAKHFYAMDQVRIQAITPEGIGAISAETTSKIVSKTFNDMTADQLNAVKWGSVASRTIGWITLSQIKALNETSVAKLGADQISRMSVAQLNSIKADAIKGLKVEFISPATLAKMPTSFIAKLNSEQITNLAEKTSRMTVEQLNSINVAAMPGLQVATISHKKIAQITPDKIALIHKEQMPKLTGEQIAKMSAQQFNALGEKLKGIKPENIAQISAKEFANIDGANLNNLPAKAKFTAAQINAIKTTENSDDNKLKLKWLEEHRDRTDDNNLLQILNKKIANFYNPQLTNIGKIRDAIYPSTIINRMSEDAVAAALSPQSTSRLAPHRIAELRTATLKKIKADVFACMKPEQYLKMTGGQFNVLNAAQIEKIPVAAIAALYSKKPADETKPYGTPQIYAKVLNAMDEKQLQEVNIQRISPKRLALIKPDKLKFIKLEKLEGDQLKKITSAQLNALGDKIATIKPEIFDKIGWNRFGKNRFGNLKVETLKQLSPEQVLALKPKHINSIRLHAKANKDADSVPTDDQRDAERKAKSDWLEKQIASINVEIKKSPSTLTKDQIENLNILSKAMTKKLKALNPAPTMFQDILFRIDRRFTASTHINKMTDKKLLGAINNKKSRLHPENIGKMRTGTMKLLEPRIIASLRGEQVTKLKAKHFNAMSPEQIKAIDVNSIKAINPNAIAGFKSAKFLHFTPEQIGALTTKQINAMTTKQFNKLTKEQIQALDLSGISPRVTARIYSKIFNAMTPGQIKSINVENISLKTIGKISPSQIAHFTADQTKNLSEKQLAKMGSKQFDAMTAEALKGIEIKFVRPGVIGNIEASQIGNLSPAQVGALTKSQMGKMNAEQFNALKSPEQIKNINVEFIGASRFHRYLGTIGKISTDIIKQLNPIQVGKLTGQQIAGMKAHQFNSMNAEQFSSIDPKALAKMKWYKFAKVNAELLESMTPEQVSMLTPKQINRMNAEKDNFAAKAAWLQKQIDILSNGEQSPAKKQLVEAMQSKLDQFNKHQQNVSLNSINAEAATAAKASASATTNAEVKQKTKVDRTEQVNKIFATAGVTSPDVGKKLMQALGLDATNMSTKEYNKFKEVADMAIPLIKADPTALNKILDKLEKDRSGGMALFPPSWNMHADKFASAKLALSQAYVDNARKMFEGQGLDKYQAIIATSNWANRSKTGILSNSSEANPLTDLNKSSEKFTGRVLAQRYQLTEEQASATAKYLTSANLSTSSNAEKRSYQAEVVNAVKSLPTTPAVTNDDITTRMLQLKQQQEIARAAAAVAKAAEQAAKQAANSPDENRSTTSSNSFRRG